VLFAVIPAVVIIGVVVGGIVIMNIMLILVHELHNPLDRQYERTGDDRLIGFPYRKAILSHANEHRVDTRLSAVLLATSCLLHF